jgi:hypothetical protein
MITGLFGMDGNDVGKARSRNTWIEETSVTIQAQTTPKIERNQASTGTINGLVKTVKRS